MSNLPSSRIIQLLSKIVFFVGLLSVISSVIVNPWLGYFYRSHVIDQYNTMYEYFLWSLLLGVLLIGYAILIKKNRFLPFINLSPLVIILSVTLLSDRFILAVLGLPLWKPDLENRYIHRPNKIMSWGDAYSNKTIRINKYGFHDDDFNIVKSSDEIRGLMIGNSITMGQGVESHETYTNQLERLLNNLCSSNTYKYQMINAGVQGYSTLQEYNILKRSLVYNPDYIFLGFCLNDITEPIIVEKKYGGPGIDYHYIQQYYSYWLNYLFNETEYGRLFQTIYRKKKNIIIDLRESVYNVKRLCISDLQDNLFHQSWENNLACIDKMHQIAVNSNIPLVILTFPYTFQLYNQEMQKPQQILISHCKESGINFIDFTKLFEEYLSAGEMINNQSTNIQYENSYKKYFLDEDHLTVPGHLFVAGKLFEYMKSRYLKKVKCIENLTRYQ